MKIRSTTVGILLMMWLLAWAGSNEAQADPYIELGTAFGKATDGTTGGIGYEWGRWDFNVAFFGPGDGDYGPAPSLRLYSVSRFFYPTWFNGRMFMGIGIAKMDSIESGSPIDLWNFKPTIGIRGDGWKVFISHYSSGDIEKLNNTGVETITFRLEL